ncbi:hypothetical protein HY732_00385 [Candidatus Uhrbacteria bacterium]|nr:hypothetical protein [Candidatus Uhrbacteria bacterium]
MKNKLILSIVFYFCFLLLTPLGLFNDWIPLSWQTGFYSVTTIDPGDDTGYYAYLRSAFFDRDFDFINERNYSHAERLNPTGYIFNNWQIGQSVLFLPFFLLGHFLALALNAMGYPISLDGYSAPYYFSTAIASATYVFIGLLLLMRLLEKTYGENVAIVSVLGIWLGSPLIYYTFIRQRMAHASEFFITVLFIFFWTLYRKSERRAHHALLGALLGFACMARIINVLFLFLYFADQFWLWLRDPRRLRGLKPIGIRFATFAAMTALTFLPQLYAWNQLDGPPFGYIMKALSVMGQNSQTASSSPASLWKKLYDLIFGPQWSVLFSTPILFLGCAGFAAFRFQPREYLPGFAAFFAVFIFLLLTALPSASYGNRWLLPGLGIFAFGFSSLLEKLLRKTWLFKTILAFTILCVAAQYMMLVQFEVTINYNDPEYSYKALTNMPWLILQRPSLLLYSTNWARVMFLDHGDKWNHDDYLFLLVFPGMQLAAIGLSLIAYAKIQTRKRGPISFNPRIVLGGVGLIVAALLVLVAIFAPTKSPAEIAARIQYFELIKQGDLLMSQGQPDEALHSFDQAASLMPQSWAPIFRKALAWNAKNDKIRVDGALKTVLDMNPDHYGALSLMGINLYSLGDFSKAEHYLKSALRQTPSNEKLFSALMAAYVRQNKVEEARKLYGYRNGK